MKRFFSLLLIIMILFSSSLAEEQLSDLYYLIYHNLNNLNLSELEKLASDIEAEIVEKSNNNKIGISTEQIEINAEPTTETIKVTSIEMASGQAIERGRIFPLEIEVYPKDATNREVDYYSSDKNIATVNQNGIVIGRKFGKATITCTATDGSGVSSTCEVTVIPASKMTNYYGCKKILNILLYNTDHIAYEYIYANIFTEADDWYFYTSMGESSTTSNQDYLLLLTEDKKNSLVMYMGISCVYDSQSYGIVSMPIIILNGDNYDSRIERIVLHADKDYEIVFLDDSSKFISDNQIEIVCTELYEYEMDIIRYMANNDMDVLFDVYFENNNFLQYHIDRQNTQINQAQILCDLLDECDYTKYEKEVFDKFQQQPLTSSKVSIIEPQESTDDRNYTALGETNTADASKDDEIPIPSLDLSSTHASKPKTSYAWEPFDLHMTLDLQKTFSSYSEWAKEDIARAILTFGLATDIAFVDELGDANVDVWLGLLNNTSFVGENDLDYMLIGICDNYMICIACRKNWEGANYIFLDNPYGVTSSGINAIEVFISDLCDTYYKNDSDFVGFVAQGLMKMFEK